MTTDWKQFRSLLNLYQLEWGGTKYDQIPDIYEVPMNPIPQNLDDALSNKTKIENIDDLKDQLPNTPFFNDFVKPFIEKTIIAESNTRRLKNT